MEKVPETVRMYMRKITHLQVGGGGSKLCCKNKGAMVNSSFWLLHNNDILMGNIWNISKGITIRSKARSRLIPDNFTFGHKAMLLRTSRQVHMRKYILTMLIGVAHYHHHIFSWLQQT